MAKFEIIQGKPHYKFSICPSVKVWEYYKTFAFNFGHFIKSFQKQRLCGLSKNLIIRMSDWGLNRIH